MKSKIKTIIDAQQYLATKQKKNSKQLMTEIESNQRLAIKKTHAPSFFI